MVSLFFLNFPSFLPSLCCSLLSLSGRVVLASGGNHDSDPLVRPGPPATPISFPFPFIMVQFHSPSLYELHITLVHLKPYVLFHASVHRRHRSGSTATPSLFSLRSVLVQPHSKLVHPRSILFLILPRFSPPAPPWFSSLVMLFFIPPLNFFPLWLIPLLRPGSAPRSVLMYSSVPM